MGRPPGQPGGRPCVGCVRLSRAEMAEVDRLRRNLVVGEWLRWLIVKEIRRSKEQERG